MPLISIGIVSFGRRPRSRIAGLWESVCSVSVDVASFPSYCIKYNSHQQCASLLKDEIRAWKKHAVRLTPVYPLLPPPKNPGG